MQTSLTDLMVVAGTNVDLQHVSRNLFNNLLTPMTRFREKETMKMFNGKRVEGMEKVINNTIEYLYQRKPDSVKMSLRAIQLYALAGFHTFIRNNQATNPIFFEKNLKEFAIELIERLKVTLVTDIPV